MVTQITAADSWPLLSEKENSILVDVRTQAELDFVGFVDPKKIKAQIVALPWRQYPGMAANPDFTDQLEEIIAKKIPGKNPEEINLFFLCRSGNRSTEAAMYMSDFGFNCYNISDGFEGSSDENGHRGLKTGWKAANLPWRQN